MDMNVTNMNSTLRNKLNILIQLAGVDEHFDPSERAFIYNICIRHGIQLDLIGDLIAAQEPVGDLKNISYETATDYLTDSILLMMVDGKVLPSEVLFCLDVGERLGFDKTSVADLINDIGYEKSISYDKLKTRIYQLKYNQD